MPAHDSRAGSRNIHRGTSQLSESQLISIVDDDASARAATERLVRSLGWRTRAFSSSEEFLQSPLMAQTSCLVSDVQMPRVDGLELQRRLASQGLAIPIIFMTGFPQASVRQQALAAGAVCYLTKPFDASTLSDCINAALERRSQA
jgi:FixJ family two-component response regulator